MSEKLQDLIVALRALADAVENSAEHDNTLQAHTGVWRSPAVDRFDLAKMAYRVADRLSSISDERLPEKQAVSVYVKAVETTKEEAVPEFWDAKTAAEAYVSYRAVLDAIDDTFDQYVTTDWEQLIDAGLIPKKLGARLRSLNSSISSLEAATGGLGPKVNAINQAHEAALALPTDLETLREASSQAAERRESAEKNSILAASAMERISKIVETVRTSEAEVRQLVENTHDAYSAATTKGLGEAFQARGDRLAKSMWVWVVGLVVALLLGSIIGYRRLAVLQDLIAQEAQSGLLWLNALLALLSVAAPVWFAWIATKQIGHRFRLSEDYSFKASVAKAYEGYRREAARLDPAFAKRLFSSALDRIDEAPIRFVENETFGSPWHEMAAAKQRRRDSARLQSEMESGSLAGNEGAGNEGEADEVLGQVTERKRAETD